MKMDKISRIIIVCLLLLVLFYLLNVTALFYFLNIARLISGSYATRSTTPDVSTQTLPEKKLWNQVWESPEPTWSITCDTAHFEYDLCYLNRQTLFDPTTSIVSVVDPTNSTPPTTIKIRPYPRKGQPEAMKRTKELTLTTSPLNASRVIAYNTPALIFSAGGFTGNVFHDFNEGWVPLFVTIEEHFIDRDVILGIVNCSEWWLIKYADLFPQFTRHPIINLDNETDPHSFPSAIVGLKTHGVMIVDPTLQRTPHPKTMHDFRALLANAYDPRFTPASTTLPAFSLHTRPKLTFLTRMDTRKLINQEDAIKVAVDVGFEVAAFEVTPKTPLRDLFRLIDTSHAMVGVHGAGLTHELFLRPKSVLLQIIPVNCGWLADMCYGKLAIRLDLEYIVYECGIHESTLEADEFAMRQATDPHDPASTLMGNMTNWYRYMNQDVKIDLERFKRYLKRAYGKIYGLIGKPVYF